MKPSRIIGALAVVIGMLTGSASIALASPTLTSPSGAPLVSGDVITFKQEGYVILDIPIATASCQSILTGEVSANGTPASGPLPGLFIFNCTNSWHMTVPSFGTFSLSSNGELKLSGSTIEATRFGITCRYKTNNTKLGTVTGSESTGWKKGKLHIEAAIPSHGGSALCGEGATTLTGSYEVYGPENLYLD